MKIINMNECNAAQLAQAAQMLADELPCGWKTCEEAMDEIKERLIPENTLLAAVDQEEVWGWCGMLPSYGGNVYELHPLVVARHKQRQGVGTSLVRALENAARQRGGLTMWLGADDEQHGGETSLAHADLYDDFPKQLQQFKPGNHQTAFYLKLGYKVVGVMPDANGIGFPDIYLAKRLQS